MRQKIRLCVMILTLALFVLPLTAQASAVGYFSLVTGEVDVLKQGKLPAVPAKLHDGVEIGDVVRTKIKAKAQQPWWTTLSLPWRRILAWPSPIMNTIPPPRSAGRSCAPSRVWCTPWSTAYQDRGAGFHHGDPHRPHRGARHRLVYPPGPQFLPCGPAQWFFVGKWYQFAFHPIHPCAQTPRAPDSDSGNSQDA